MKLLLGVCLLSLTLNGSTTSSWHDPSNHTVRLVTVDKGVQLEVLDWGGSGPSLVLLAGSGLTAHVYDGFAERLVGRYHVYGITRRGFGLSTHVESGFTEQRLADDVVGVLDALQLAKPVLVGHSMAGGEMTTLVGEHPNRVMALVYLDAVRDPTRDYAPLRKRASDAGISPPLPSSADMKTFDSYRAWQTKEWGFAFPESELRNEFATNPDGGMGAYKTVGKVFEAMSAGAAKPNYTNVRVPVLALVAIPASAEQEVGRNYQFKNSREREAVQENHAEVLRYIHIDEQSVRSCACSAQVVEIEGADHYLFLSNQDDVLRELQTFLAGLH